MKEMTATRAVISSSPSVDSYEVGGASITGLEVVFGVANTALVSSNIWKHTITRAKPARDVNTLKETVQY